MKTPLSMIRYAMFTTGLQPKHSLIKSYKKRNSDHLTVFANYFAEIFHQTLPLLTIGDYPKEYIRNPINFPQFPCFKDQINNFCFIELRNMHQIQNFSFLRQNLRS